MVNYIFKKVLPLFPPEESSRVAQWQSRLRSLGEPAAVHPCPPLTAPGECVKGSAPTNRNMGQQTNKIQKRRRRIAYNKRKNEQAKVKSAPKAKARPARKAAPKAAPAATEAAAQSAT